MLCLLAVALLLVCGVPGGWFWTFAVYHGPTGADCPKCAAARYLDYGPLGGYSQDAMLFDRVLCPAGRAQLHHQAEQIRAAVAVLKDQQLGHFRTDYNGSTTSTAGADTTVTRGVLLVYLWKPGAPNAGSYWTIDARIWTFHHRHLARACPGTWFRRAALGTRSRRTTTAHPPRQTRVGHRRHRSSSGCAIWPNDVNAYAP